MFDEAGKYEIQRERAGFYYTYTPKMLCGEDFIKTDEELTFLLSKAHRNLGILEGMAKAMPNIDIIESIFIKKESLLSCLIDRSTATFEDIMRTSRKKSEDEKAVLNYIDSVIFGKSRVLENQFSNNLVCDMYKILKNDKNVEEECCGFRGIQIFDIPGAVGIDMKMYNPTAPEDIEVVMDDLICYINKDDDIDKLIKTALAYYQFITISPFENENKKMARMMISLLLQHNKILSKQLLCISSYIFQDKIRFDDSVSTVRIFGDYKQWVKAFLKGIIITAERTITIIDNLLQLKIRDDGKVINAAKSVRTNMLLLELLRKKPIIDIKETAKELNMAYNTVAKSVVDLQKMGILAQNNNLVRNRCFVYVEYLNIIMDKTNVDD